MNPSIRTVLFKPRNCTVNVLPGTTLLEAAATAARIIDTPCGGVGTCGKCRVQVVRGAAKPNAAELDCFSEDELALGWRLACQCRIEEDCEVFVPDGVLFADQHRILATAQTEEVTQVAPAVRKRYLKLDTPSLQDNRSDLARIEAYTGPLKISTSLLQMLAQKLRACRFSGTAVLTDHHLIDFEAGDTARACHGVAFDIGTTTLVGVLLDLCTGEPLATTSCMNPQVRHGDDVLSRIRHAGAQRGLEDLQSTLLETLNDMLARLCEEASIGWRHVYEVAFSGNTTMQHLLCGMDPTALGQAPFVPTYTRGLLLSAQTLGIKIHPEGMAYIFPVIGGFVGGDTVAGMLATGMTTTTETVLMIDIGTNGEIVLAHNGSLWAASTAAGPAFEGARISCGMRATQGAIEKVIITDDLQCAVIGNQEAKGICGSGLIDLCAELLRYGLCTPKGRLLPPEELPETVSEALRRRVRRTASDEVIFALSNDDDAAVTLSEKDIRELQLACGAIRAGITILLKQARLSLSDVSQILIAGGFGSFIRRDNAQRIGLLPPGLAHHQIRYVGNVSLSGAQWVLLSQTERHNAEELARRTRQVELSNDVDFAMEFAMAMTFPEE